MIIEERGLQPDDVTPLNDNSTRTCSTFASTRRRHTQIFAQSVCSTDKMSITLVGQRMKCDNDLYVAGLAGSDVGKPLNKWQSCQRRWENTTDDGVEWCSFNCDCINGCDQIMVLRWPKILADTSWNLCDIIQSCTGKFYHFSLTFSQPLLHIPHFIYQIGFQLPVPKRLVTMAVPAKTTLVVVFPTVKDSIARCVPRILIHHQLTLRLIQKRL